MEIVEATAMEIAEKWEQLIGLARRAKDWFDNRAATAKKNYAQCLEDKVARIDQISHTGTCAAFLACKAANAYLSDAWFGCAEPIASNVDLSGALECKTKQGPQIINSDASPKPHVLCVPQ